MVARYDEHAPEGGYLVRSLYFDTLRDLALREKLDSVNNREKFRIRCYDRDFSYIQLEKKSKRNRLGEKAKARVTEDEVKALLDGDIAWMNDPSRPVVVELLSKMRSQGLRPKVVVEYRREPFVYRPGNVRVTIDKRVRTGLSNLDLFDPDLLTVEVMDRGTWVLEVKYNDYLPDHIASIIGVPAERSAISKYTLCRRFDPSL